MLWYSKQKFSELNSFDIRVTQNERIQEDIKNSCDHIQMQLDKLGKLVGENERHMTKILPIQMTGLMFETLKKGISPRVRGKL